MALLFGRVMSGNGWNRFLYWRIVWNFETLAVSSARFWCNPASLAERIVLDK